MPAGPTGIFRAQAISGSCGCDAFRSALFAGGTRDPPLSCGELRAQNQFQPVEGKPQRRPESVSSYPRERKWRTVLLLTGSARSLALSDRCRMQTSDTTSEIPAAL